jgi:hypothetical protein
LPFFFSLSKVTQVVNDTNPVFYYCGTPGHCEKGMFGIINPPNSEPWGGPGSAMSMISNVTASNPSTQASYNYTSSVTSNCSTAASWGMGMNMSAMPSWAQPYVLENVMYTQAYISLNTEVIANGNATNWGVLAETPNVYPTDIAANVRATDGGYGTGTSSISTTAASSPTSTGGASPQTNSKSGAGALSSPRVAVAVVAVVAAWFAL